MGKQRLMPSPQAPEQHKSLSLVLHLSPVAIFQSPEGQVGGVEVEVVVGEVLCGSS